MDFQADYITVVEARPIMSSSSLPLLVKTINAPYSAVSAIAEHLVTSVCGGNIVLQCTVLRGSCVSCSACMYMYLCMYV